MTTNDGEGLSGREMVTRAISREMKVKAGVATFGQLDRILNAMLEQKDAFHEYQKQLSANMKESVKLGAHQMESQSNTMCGRIGLPLDKA